MRGARAPRTSGLTWAQGHNNPRPPRPRRPLPIPFVQPSPPGHPVPRGLHKEEDTSGLCSRTRRRLRQDSLLQKQKSKNHRNKTQQKKQSNTLRTEPLLGLRGAPDSPVRWPPAPCQPRRRGSPRPECSTSPARRGGSASHVSPMAFAGGGAGWANALGFLCSVFNFDF